MNCLDWKEKISGYVDGEISPEEALSLREHFAACGTCRALERRMRAMDPGVGKVKTEVSAEFRDKLFSRMEKEELFPRRPGLFVFSLRWAAVPLAVAVAFAAVLLIAPETAKNPVIPPSDSPRIVEGTPQARTGDPIPMKESPPSATVDGGSAAPGADPAVAVSGLSSEEREIIAHLDIFEDGVSIDEQGDEGAIEFFEPGAGGKG